MAFLDKLGELAKTAADKANDSLEINRINSDINMQKDNIQEYQRQLGQYYWAKFVVGERLEEEAMAICDKIVAAKDQIKQLEAEIEQVKASREAQRAERAEQKRREAAREAAKKAAETAQEVEILDAADQPMGKFCGVCGAPMTEGQKFCSNCGSAAEKANEDKTDANG